MLAPRVDLGIAQTIFYVPMAALAIFLLFYRRQSPRSTWTCLMMFSLIRLAGGVVNSVFEDGHESVGLFVAVLVLLTIGTVPLVVSTFFFAQMILRNSSHPGDQLLGKRISIAFRVVFVLCVALLATGASLTPTPASYTTGQAFLKAGYVLLGCIVVFLIAFLVYLWSLRDRVDRRYIRYLIGATMALPFLVVRIVYAFLSIFDNDGGRPFYESKWSYLAGSLAAYILMGLVMEYVVVCIYIFIGMMISPSEDSGDRVEATSSGGRLIVIALDGSGKP